MKGVVGVTPIKTDRGCAPVDKLIPFTYENEQPRSNRPLHAIQPFSESRINRIVDLGIQQTYLVKFENGATLECTDGVKFMGMSFWRTLGFDLFVGDEVCLTNDKYTRVAKIEKWSDDLHVYGVDVEGGCIGANGIWIKLQ